MKRFLPLLLVALSLVTFPGCTSLSLKGERVRLTKTASDVVGCRAVGNVEASVPYSPWQNNLKNRAAALGGDVVLRDSGWPTIHGTAYDCGGRYAKR